MIPREILKMIRQIELRTNRLASQCAPGARLCEPQHAHSLHSAENFEIVWPGEAAAGRRPAVRFGTPASARLSTGGAPASSPRREPWDQVLRISPAPAGVTDLPSRRSFAPAGADAVGPFTHGLRRGLLSSAAPQLPESDSYPPRSALGVPHSALR